MNTLIKLSKVALLCCAVSVFARSEAPTAGTTHKPLRSLVSFTAEPVKPTFVLGEPIVFSFKLTNRSGERILAAKCPYNRFATVNLYSRDGKQVEWHGGGKILSEGYSPDDFVILAPGESTTCRATISIDRDRGYRITRSGEYCATAEYSMGPPEYFAPAAKGALVASGPVVSPRVTFGVTATTKQRP
jgi:hypothetical protein